MQGDLVWTQTRAGWVSCHLVSVVDSLSVFNNVERLRQVGRRVQVIENDEYPVADGHDQVARLPRVPPHLELIAVAAYLVHVFALVKAELLLPVIPAVVVVEK